MNLLGNTCALSSCRRKLLDDEGVGIAHRGHFAWLHDSCAKRWSRAQERRRKRTKVKAGLMSKRTKSKA